MYLPREEAKKTLINNVVNRFICENDLLKLNISPVFTREDIAVAVHPPVYYIGMSELFKNKLNQSLMSDDFTVCIGNIVSNLTGDFAEKFDIREEFHSRKKCIICGNDDLEEKKHGIIYSTRVTCSACYNCAMFGLDGEEGSYLRDDMWKSNIKNDFSPKLDNVSDSDLSPLLCSLIESMGYIPPSTQLNYSANPGRKNLMEKALWNMVLCNDFKMIKSLSRTCSGKWYKNRYGSWLKALVTLSVLPDGTRETFYGTMTIAKDGHECRSLAEKTIDDWLYFNNIPHEIEPYYPFDSELNQNGKLRADWKVGEHFIEYCGLMSKQQYSAKIDNKIALCKKHKIQLLTLISDDLFRLDRKLAKYREE